MHYRRADLTNKTGTPNPTAPDPTIDTIDPTPPYLFFLNIMGNVYERTLSKLDRAGMAAIYGSPAVLPSAVVTNTKDSGSGSLRSAIYYAFDRSTELPPGATTVTFHIPTSDPNYNATTGVFTISPRFLMVAPGAGTTIDGSTQTAFTGNTNPNGPEILVDGSQIAAQNLNLFAPGFLLHEMNCTIRNLIINGFNQQGIALDGTRAALFGTSAGGNVISGCYIGTDHTGGTGVPNAFPGIEILGGASGNTIGGVTTAARNVISGNAHYGISINGSGSSNNLVEGNYIGVNAAGTGALANAAAGIGLFSGAHNNTIGGATAGARNVISGNTAQGIQILNSGTNSNVVIGNFIGVNAAGDTAVANGFVDQANDIFVAGIDIFDGAQNNIIGGTIAGSGNVISGNAASGVAISQSGTNGNAVQGNLIGTNALGTAAIGNGYADPTHTPFPILYAGVSLFGGAQAQVIGGTSGAAINVISGNAAQGVTVSGSDTNQNLVQGNFIGLNAAGTAALPNAFEGVAIFGGAQFNTIGGTTAGARNVISGNGARGIGFFDAATSNNSIQGNFIGLNAAGTAAVGNAFSGVEFYLATNNTVGGTAAGARNFISGNHDRGVLIDGSSAAGNVVQGNTIGLNINGAATPNLNQGVTLFAGAHANTVGGSAVGASNIISGNTNEGVALYDSATIQNTISRNSIIANSGKGIVLNTGANSTQPYPILSSATLSTATNPNGTDVTGSLTAAVGTTYAIEFFASPTGDPSGFGEGQYFIGSASVTTNGAGAANFTAPLAATVPAGSIIATTATDPLGNTSEFSGDSTVVATADSDGDGMPNNYETAHGLNPNISDGNLDSDGDGLTNLQEFRAGTDPRSAGSVLRISAVSKANNAISVSVPTVNGKTYRLESRDDLVTGSWSTMIDQIFGAGGTMQITDPSAAAVAKRFYRIVVEP
jgi:titin